MNRYLKNLILAVLIVIWVAGCTPHKDMPAAAYAKPAETPRITTAKISKTTDTTPGKGVLYKVVRDPRIEKMAKVLVEYSVAVNKGDVVVIEAPPVAEPLVIALCKAVIEAGGHPHIRMQPAIFEELLLRYGSDEQLKYVSPLDMHIMETMDVYIYIEGEINTRTLTNVDPARQALRSAATVGPWWKRLIERAAKNELRWTATLFPTDAYAQDADMSLIEYEDFVFRACLLDKDDPVAAWREIERKQQKVVDLLNTKKRLRVEAPNGTDLTMSVEGRKWVKACGKITIPDGEVFTGPVEDSVEGTIVFDFPAVKKRRECKGVRLRFEKGRVVEATAEKGQDFLIKMLDQDEGPRRTGEFSIACNYGITKFTKNLSFDEKIGGTVHLAVGNGFPETGSKNKSGLHWDMICDLRNGGRITADGEIIYENGKFTAID
jgi:aminopeptidase